MATQTLQLQRGGGPWTVTNMVLVGGGVSALVLLFNSSRKSKRNINNIVFQGVTRNEILENEPLENETQEETKSPLPDDEFITLTTNSNTIEGGGGEPEETFDLSNLTFETVAIGDNPIVVRDFLAHFKHGSVETVGTIVEPSMELATAILQDKSKAEWIHRMLNAEKLGIVKFNTHSSELPYNLYAIRDYIWANATQKTNRQSSKVNGLRLSSGSAKNYLVTMLNSLDNIEQVFSAWFQNIKIGRRLQRAVHTKWVVNAPSRRHVSIIGISETGEDLDLGIELEVGLLGQLASEGITIGENLPPRETDDYNKLVDFAIEKINGWELPFPIVDNEMSDLFDYLGVTFSKTPYNGVGSNFVNHILTVQKKVN